MSDRANIAPGATIAGYELEQLLGRGGMGEVFRAHDPRLERPVALKVLAPWLASNDAFRERLLRESRLAAGLDHPNVVPVYDAGEVDGTLFIAMRFVDGTDLRKLLLVEGPLAPDRAIAIASQVGGALDAAHARGLVHRDVKPSNVLIDRAEGREHCYLADFGLSQSISDGPVTDGELSGTVDYVAPEQIRGDPVDGRADVYAFGCLLYEALTGERPFAGSSDIATIFAHLEEEPVPASTRRPELPAAIDTVLNRAMAKERDARYDTCAALVEDARAALGVSALSGRSSRTVAAAVLVVAFLLAGAVAAVLALTQDKGTAAPPHGTLVRIDARSRAVAGRYATAAMPTHVVTAAGNVWFAAGEALWRLDPQRGEPDRIETLGPIHDLAALGDTVFVAREGKQIFEGIVVPYGADGFRGDGVAVLACNLAADPSIGLWASTCDGVQRIGVLPARLTIEKAASVPISGATPPTSGSSRWCLCAMAGKDDSLWAVGDAADPRVWRIAASGKVVATIDLPSAPRSVAVSGGAAWVSASLDDVVYRIDATTNRIVRRIAVGRGAAGLAVGGGAVWVANELDGTVSRIELASGQVTDEVAVGGRPFEVAFDRGTVWVTVDERT